MEKKGIFINAEEGKRYAKDVLVLSPYNLGSAITKESWKILAELQRQPLYPKELAKRMKMNEQTTYYYIKKLEKHGLIRVIRSEEKQGALCKYYGPNASVFAAELEGGRHEISGEDIIHPAVASFFGEYAKDKMFDGSLIVGSPQPHGPFLTASRDGHYAIQLALFLGSFIRPSNRFIVKLDTEAKAEHTINRNLILIGGPVTNTLCSGLNNKLNMRFEYDINWSIYSEKTKNRYAGELDGLIAKVTNPWDATKKIIVIAGLKQEGTKTCVLALTQQFEKLLKAYTPYKDFYTIVRGLDGDGKVDDISLLETMPV